MAESLARVLIADDDAGVLDFLEHVITDWGYPVATARTKGELLSRLVLDRPALLLLLDLRFGEIDGMELLRQLLEMSPGLNVVMLTGHGCINSAVTAMKHGASDFLTKPPDRTRLRMVLENAARLHREQGRVEPSSGLRMLGESPTMKLAMDRLRSVAPTDATVLILGESGTGKELAAQTAHELSARKDGPFVPLNMAAMPRELTESLLFGHEKGAFTGADRAQAGACENADKGTLFLDEIGELELRHQAKLLRFLQERTVQRVGSTRTIDVDVRVIAATNRDLIQRVRDGHFREDLYFRLNVVPVELPALRQRREDIPALANHFLQRAAAKYSKQLSFTPQALMAIENFDWPGNIRQMENLIERVAILCTDPAIGPEMFAHEFKSSGLISTPTNRMLPPMPMSPPFAGVEPGNRLVDQIEKQAIVDALARTGGSVREASHQLGLSQATVYRKLSRYSIDLKTYSRAGV